MGTLGKVRRERTMGVVGRDETGDMEGECESKMGVIGEHSRGGQEGGN